MRLTYDDFGIAWSRYERNWFSSRLDWMTRPLRRDSENTERGHNAQLQKSSKTEQTNTELEEMNCDQIVRSASRAVGTIKAVAHADRLTILLLIATRPRTVSDLTQILGLRQPTVSQLLAKLRSGKLVTAKRMGKQVEYCISDSNARLVVDHLLRAFPPLLSQTSQLANLQEEILR